MPLPTFPSDTCATAPQTPDQPLVLDARTLCVATICMPKSWGQNFLVDERAIPLSWRPAGLPKTMSPSKLARDLGR